MLVMGHARARDKGFLKKFIKKKNITGIFFIYKVPFPHVCARKNP